MKRIIIDAQKCDGCKNCSTACMQAHRKDEGSIYDLDLTDKANESRNRVIGLGGGIYKPLFCRHCDEPDCVASCMSGALRKNTQTGLVEYDETKCASCFMCVMNCSYGTLKPDTVSKSRIIKCDFCKEHDYDPACVKSCPKKAIVVQEVNL